MGAVVGIFILGCFVAAIVALGLMMSMSALAPDGPGAFEGKAAEDRSHTGG